MKAVVYQAPFSIAAENVPDPELQHPNDGIVQDHFLLYLWLGLAHVRGADGNAAQQGVQAEEVNRQN